jgi:hypothetical protein
MGRRHQLCHPRAGRRAHAIQDFQSSVSSFPLLTTAKFHSLSLPSSDRLPVRNWYTHIEIICLQNCVNVGIDCDIIGEIMDGISYMISETYIGYDIIDL